MPNTAPTLTGLATSVTFGENAVNAAPALLDADVTFGDAEGVFTDGELTVTGLLAEDRIAIRSQGFAGGQIGVFGLNVTYNGVAIGVISGGVGTTFRVRFNSDASPLAIDALIQNLTYANVSDTPTAARTLTIRVADDQGASTTASMTVNVTPESDVPLLTGLVTSATFAENAVNAAPAVIDGDVTFVVGSAGFANARLTVSGLLAEDRVAVRNQGTGAGQIGVSGSNVTYGGTVIGTVSGGTGGTLFVTLTAAASQVSVDALIQNLTYADVSNTPTASRTLHIGLLDGAGIALNATPPVFAARTDTANPLNGVDVGFYSTPSFVDLDGDGDLDAVVGADNGTLRSFRNTGGVFTELTGAANPFDGIDVGSDATPSFVDLDGDGDLDAVVGVNNGALRSFRNTGGVFIELTGAANPFNGLNVGYFSAPSFVDLDGDGDLDAVVGEFYGTLRSFRNTGGVFTELTGAANPFDGIDVGSSARPSFVDLDGDGDLDAVVGVNNGTLRSFRNDGGVFTGLIGAANPFNGVDVGNYSTPSFGDLDGDGDLDAVVGANDGTLRTYINTASNGANVVVTVTAEKDPPALTGVSPSVTFAENAVNAAPALLDGDVTFVADTGGLGGGRLTVSGLLAEDRVAVRDQGTGAGQIGVSGANVTYGGVVIGTVSGGTGGTLFVTLTAAASQVSVDALIQNLTYADVSNTPTASRTLHIGLLDGAGIALNATPAVFAERTGVANPFNGLDVGGFSAPSFVDLDSDGDLDAVVGLGDGTLRSFRNTGGVFTPLIGAANPFNGLDVGSFAKPSFVDLDGDGDLDSVVGSNNGTLRSFRNDGGVFSELIGAANPFNGVDVGNGSTPSFVDLDGDGDLDAVVGEGYGTLRSFRNTGGVFTALTGTANPFDGVDVGYNAAPSFVDLDGDGDLDAVVGANDGTLRSFRNTGGVFTALTGTANPFNGVDVGTLAAPSFADLDGDGDLDAVMGNNYGALRTYINTASNGVDMVVTVTAESEVPALTGLAATVTFAENAVNAAPAVMDTNVTFTSDTRALAGGRVTVSGLLAEDRVAVRNEGTAAGQIGVSGSNVTYGGVVIGTVSGGTGATLFVTLTAGATQASVDALIQNLTYANVSNTPTASRTLHIGLLDGASIALNATPAVFAARTGTANPFDGIDVSNYSTPSFVDLDGDGDLDAVVGEFYGTLQSFRNSGGVFTELTGATNPLNGVDVGSSSTPSFVDLDGDGDLDAVVGVNNGTLRSFRNTGGVFTALTGAANPFDGVDVGYYSMPSFVDLDGDGDLDAVVGDIYGTLRSFRNSGGVFTELTGAANPFNGVDVGDFSAPSFVDLDSDGDLDAVVGERYGTLRSFRNTGGVFTALTGTANPFNGVDVGFSAAPSFADLDGDGDLDAVVGDSIGTLRTYINTASSGANIVVTVTSESDVPALTGLAGTVTFAENTVNAAPTVIDGDVTFVVGSAGLGGGRLTVSGLLAEDRVAVRNEGTGAGQMGVSGASITYGGVVIGTVSGGVGGTFAVALNRAASSAAVDALIQNLTYANVSDTPTAARTLHIGLIDGSGYALNPAAANAYTALTGAANPFGAIVGEYQAPAFADLDGDGDLDLLVGQYGSGLRAYRNDGGSFVVGTNPLPGSFAALHEAVAFGDYDGDGDVDAVVGDASGQLRTFRHDAGGFVELTGGANPLAGIDVGLFARPALGDLDNDGDLDLLVGSQDGPIRAFRNTGGVFAELTGSANPLGGSIAGYSSPSFVDLDGDGDMDVVVGSSDGALRSFRNTNGVFTELTGAANPFAGVTARGGAAGFTDIDGDGDLDAVVGTGPNGALRAFTNTSSSGANVVVTVTAEPDGPRLSAVVPSVTFAENASNAAPAIIDGDVTFTDELGLTGGTLTVSGLLAEDRVAIRSQGSGAGQIGISGGAVTYGGAAFATVTGGIGGTLTVAFTSAVTAAAVDALIQNLTYANASNTPTAVRTLTIAVTGTGTASASVVVGVTPEADASVAAADVAGVAANATATIAVLDNDTAGDSALAVATIEGQAVSAGQSVRLASGALVTLNGNGTLGYDPSGAYDALVSPATAAATGAVNSSAVNVFSYALVNGGTASVSVTVTGVTGPGDRLAGDAERNFLTGTSGNDVFLLSQGGDDAAFGGDGDDQFLFGAALTAADRVDGGAGSDAVGLQGNYALTLGVSNLANVEALTLLSGSDVRFGDLANNRYSYSLATVDDTVAAGRELLVNASQLLSGENFTFDGSSERDGGFVIYGGAGRDTVTGGAGTDRLLMADGRFTAGDTFDGGGGNDALVLRGDYAGANAVTFQANAITNVEALTVLSAFDTRFGALGASYSYTVTMNDANVAAGMQFIVNGSTMRAGEVLRFSGAAETDGSYRILAGGGNDVLVGSRGNDTILGGLGADDMTGGLGADVFRYDTAGDSTRTAMDLIRDFALGQDKLDLSRIDANANTAANDAFTFIDARTFGGIAGELRSFVDQATGRVFVEGDTNGDGVADFVVGFDAALTQPLQLGDLVP